MGRMTKERDHLKDYRGTWKEIVENADGSLNKDQVMKELSDFSMLIDHISKLYDELSGGMISYPQTHPEHVVNLYNDRIAEANDDGYVEGYDKGYEEGFEKGQEKGDGEGYVKGYNVGYKNGKEDGNG